MTVHVRLFAAAKQLAGAERVAVELSDGATIAGLREALNEQFPALRDLLCHALFAVGVEYAGEATPLTAGADVACIPPVSGG